MGRPVSKEEQARKKQEAIDLEAMKDAERLKKTASLKEIAAEAVIKKQQHDIERSNNELEAVKESLHKNDWTSKGFYEEVSPVIIHPKFLHQVEEEDELSGSLHDLKIVPFEPQDKDTGEVQELSDSIMEELESILTVLEYKHKDDKFVEVFFEYCHRAVDRHNDI